MDGVVSDPLQPPSSSSPPVDKAPICISEELLKRITNARRDIHKAPELSCDESNTAKYIVNTLYKIAPPDNIFTGIGGHGVIAIYNSGKPGPTVMFRAELDALPVQETNSFEYKSQTDGISHKCGHDGHMATVLGIAGVIRPNRLVKHTSSSNGSVHKLRAGKVVLVFQPAEEVGSGAASILSDPTFASVVPHPDFVYAYHNVPAYPLGAVILRRGVFTASVRSMQIQFQGTPSHAAEPENGRSPSFPIALMLLSLDQLANNDQDSPLFQGITPVFVTVGERGSNGVNPGFGELHLTIRTWGESRMETLIGSILSLLEEHTANQEIVKYSVTYSDIFIGSENSDVAMDVLYNVCNGFENILHNSSNEIVEPVDTVNDVDDGCDTADYTAEIGGRRAPQIPLAGPVAGGVSVVRGGMVQLDRPMRWGEDFGGFTQRYCGALFGIGAGEHHPALHNDDYDFPDEILEVGVNVFAGILQQLHMLY